MSGIEGKVVAITGASSGIGEATALLLAEHGAKIVLGARRPERLEALATRIEKAGGEAAGRRAPRTIFAPRSASRSAVASPMPLLAPVIATTLPSIPDMLGIPSSGGVGRPCPTVKVEAPPLHLTLSGSAST